MRRILNSGLLLDVFLNIFNIKNQTTSTTGCNRDTYVRFVAFEPEVILKRIKNSLQYQRRT